MHFLKPADVSAEEFDGMSALHVACGGGNVECVRMLLSCGANVHALDKHGDAPVHIAAFRDQPAVFEVLLAHKADIQLKIRYFPTLSYFC